MITTKISIMISQSQILSYFKMRFNEPTTHNTAQLLALSQIQIFKRSLNHKTLFIQSSAVITRSNMVTYWINNCRNWGRISLWLLIHKDLEKIDLVITASHCIRNLDGKSDITAREMNNTTNQVTAEFTETSNKETQLSPQIIIQHKDL